MSSVVEIIKTAADFPKWCIVCRDDHEGAWSDEQGRPGWIDFAIYEVEGLEQFDDGTELPVFETDDNYGTTKLNDARWTMRGSVKWDGCANFEAQSDVMLHICNGEELALLGAALNRAYALSVGWMSTDERLS